MTARLAKWEFKVLAEMLETGEIPRSASEGWRRETASKLRRQIASEEERNRAR